VTVHITKADGTTEPFKVEKLRRSLRRSGASKQEVQTVVDHILHSLQEGMHTQEIYRRAFQYLHKIELPAAARYSLRRALFNLGPTGFPFESFLARLFEVEGYTTRVGVELEGKCVRHELDVAAYKQDHSFVAEAKFHSRPGIKSDLQVAMYSYARLLDLREQRICQEDICGITEFWLITNTKFTSSAVTYGTCVGLTMLSWNFPNHDNLHDRIQRAKIYPITVLQRLSSAQAQILIDHGVLLCADIVQQPSVLKRLHLPDEKQSALLHEAKSIVA
jgi:hypothetical protein